MDKIAIKGSIIIKVAIIDKKRNEFVITVTTEISTFVAAFTF